MELRCASMQAASAPCAAPAPRVAASTHMQRRKHLSRPARCAGASGDTCSAFRASSLPPHHASLGHSSRSSSRKLVSAHNGAAEATTSAEGEVLAALSRIIDPDFGEDIVACGFVRDLATDQAAGSVRFKLQLTTPACPVKAEFERQARQFVGELPWVRDIQLEMGADPPKPIQPTSGRPGGLQRVKHVIAVSSCKGGVGKSTTAVNLAYTLLQMGGRVGILDADVHGPSLPTMISPQPRVMIMDPATRALTPVEYQGVKAVSFGFAGQGSAIMRGAMVSGLIQQLLTTAAWGELDYLVVDFPPGTGDIQLTLCQTVSFSAAVIVTTPQKLAYVDVAKGIRMFSRLQVPCVAVVENMSFFDGADGRRYTPFGAGSGDRIQREFGLPHLIRFPIAEDISQAGDGGRPLVVAAPDSQTAAAFMELGAAVVREVAKLDAAPRSAVRFDESVAAFAVTLPAGGTPAAMAAQPADTDAMPAIAAAPTASATAAAGPGDRQGGAAAERREFFLHPATVRRNDTSAAAIDEWTGERMAPAVADDVRPTSVAPCGNYAVQILWEDGFNQVAPFDLLAGLERLSPQQLEQRAAAVDSERAAATAAEAAAGEDSGEPPPAETAAQRILVSTGLSQPR